MIFQRIFIFAAAIALSACTQKRDYILKMPKDANSINEAPYVDRGVCYKPQTCYNYCKYGLASWYGGKFHGRRTASGVVYNKNLYTAASRTLPIPCVVEVTNLSNGKKIKVLVNDRGPFIDIHSRIIDLSEKAAKTLNFYNKGVTNVKVECLPKESALAALYYKRKPYYSTNRKLTLDESKYIKECIIGDYAPEICKLLKRNSKINERNIRNRRNTVCRK